MRERGWRKIKVKKNTIRRVCQCLFFLLYAYILVCLCMGEEGGMYGLAIVSVALVPAVCAAVYSLVLFIRRIRLRRRRAVGAAVVVDLPRVEIIIIRRGSICAICMDGVADHRVSSLCPHRTCAECLGKIGGRCPFCRAARSS